MKKLTPLEVDVNSLHRLILAGPAAFDPEEKRNLGPQFSDLLGKIVEMDSLTETPQIAPLLVEMTQLIFQNKLARPIAEELKPVHFFKFGNYLLAQLSNDEHPARTNLIQLAHGFLDIFRLSEFLLKLQENPRWADLVLDMIRASRFSLASLMQQRVRDYENKTLFRVLHGQQVNDYTWRQVEDRVQIYRKALISLARDESGVLGKVAFLTENSLTMAELDLACLSAGIINIMIPANSVTQHIAYILNQTEARIAIVSDEKQLAKIKAVKLDCPHLKNVVLIEGNSVEDWVFSLAHTIQNGRQVDDSVVAEYQNQIEPDALASIMYTSGTTGDPKGIMFSQTNIVYKRFCRAMALPEIGDTDVYLSYLPLYHTFGRWLEMTGALFWGATYCFMENPAAETMVKNMQMVQPTIFISIPKKWYQLQEQVGRRVDVELGDPKEIRRILHEVSGGKLRWGLSAAGYLSPETFQFFQRHGVELMSGFGMTEATGGITMTRPDQYKPNSLGQALPGIEIKVADDGELLIRGAYVMLGYYGDPEGEPGFDAEGWFPTGDIMRMDKDKAIEIIDRKKDIYKNIRGETVAPQKIENFFRDFEYVQQVFLVGDHQPHNTALIYPADFSADPKMARMDEAERKAYFATVMVTVNKFLAPFERILDFRIIDRPFSVEKGELTPKGTYKRRVIEQNFAEIIADMYKKKHISLDWQGLEVRIPSWFLREKGCLSTDLVIDNDQLLICKQKIALPMKPQPEQPCYLIGSLYYQSDRPWLDLHRLLTNPVYWLGNAALLGFTSEQIYQWYRIDRPQPDFRFCGRQSVLTFDPEWRQLLLDIKAVEELSLHGLHLAALLIQTDQAEHVELAANYLKLMLRDDSLPYYQLALEILSRPMLTDGVENRRTIFRTGIRHKKGDDFRRYIELFLSHNHDLFDSETIATIVDLGSKDENLLAIEKIIENEVEGQNALTEIEHTALPYLFELLIVFGTQHPTRYKRIRQTLVRYQLQEEYPQLLELAGTAHMRLEEGFRNWLGINQTVAVDMETGQEYSWQDVVIFEEGVSSADRDRLMAAIINTPLVREAIFLLTGKVMIRLNNIPQGGVWISLLNRDEEKNTYRLAVQTRYQRAYDITVNVSQTMTPERIRDETNWLIHAGSQQVGFRLVEDFAGYWPAYNLWSEEYLYGETVDKYLRRKNRQADEKIQTRLYHLWPFFVWTATKAFMSFWKRTAHRYQIEQPTPDKIIIPTHDYQTGTRLFSISHRVKSDSIVGGFNNLLNSFLNPTEDQYPYLKRDSIVDAVFSGMVDVEGEEKGLAMLKQLRRELLQMPVSASHKTVLPRLEAYIAGVEANGFIPKFLYFAIKRYKRWLALNQNADLSAQAQTLNEIYETYHLPEGSPAEDETRTRYFLETVFADSEPTIRDALASVYRQQRERQLTHDETLKLISAVQQECTLNEREMYFLTRLSFPFVKPTDKAVLVPHETEGTTTADLVVRAEDNEGSPFLIRQPISPREISRLHQLFLDANLPVRFSPDHKFLIAVTETGFVVAGLSYEIKNSETAHMDKIVVDMRYRRKGISEGLMNELFNRLRIDGMTMLTTGFFRPEYFYRFDFKIERHYAGLVKELKRSDEPLPSKL